MMSMRFIGKGAIPLCHVENSSSLHTRHSPPHPQGPFDRTRKNKRNFDIIKDFLEDIKLWRIFWISF